MCGIAGLVHLDGRPLSDPADRRILEGMGNAMQHRGPDDAGITIWNNLGLVFRRLSIIDIDGGAQPFHTLDGRISSITNGEIYNHRDLRTHLAKRHEFRTKSDCEVLPFLYLDRGLEMFEPVNGMYATALLDRHLNRLLLARDRLGEKPLFYSVLPHSHTLVFASELKALFVHPEVPRRFDWQTMLTRVQNIDITAGERPSGYLGVDRLPAGAMMDLSLHDGNYRIHRYWQLPDRDDTNDQIHASECIERYRALLNDSMRLREVADVGCGLFLSGGIDSSALAALASRRQAMPTFSIRNASTLEDAEAAARVARHLGMPNHQISFDQSAATLKPDHWRRILWSCEYADINAEQLFKYYLHAYARQRYPALKVILLGQGSDEFNGGYLSMLLDSSPPFGDQDWLRMDEAIRREDVAHVAFTTGLVGRAGHLVRHGVIRQDFISSVLGGRDSGLSTWDRYVKLYRGNLDTHLWHEDRTAAAHSTENRAPFLDHRLVEFLAQIPVRLHANLFTDKRILRQAMKGLLPVDIINRRKGPLFYGREQHHTFRMMHSVLSHNQGELLDQAVEGSRLTDGPIDETRLHAMAKRVACDPNMAHFEELLAIVNMGVLAHMSSTLEVPSGPSINEELPIKEIHQPPGSFLNSTANKYVHSAGLPSSSCPWV